MDTQEALTGLLKEAEERGLSGSTRRKYQGYLRHFVAEYPDLPTDSKIIEDYLKKRKETPGHRGAHFKMLQALYAYLDRAGVVGKLQMFERTMGRPRREKVGNNPGSQELADFSTLQNKKVVPGGGHSVSTSTSISTADAVEAFIKSRKVQGVSKRTLEGYPSRFKPFIGKFPTLPLTVEPIEEFLGSLTVDIETRWSYNKDIKALYHFLEQRKRIPKDLFTFPRVKVPRKVRRVLSAADLRQLFPFAQNFEEKAILILLIDSKIRASELLSMDREKVYPDHITVTGKTGERDVPINPETYDVLIQLAASGHLFRSPTGKRMRREYLRIIVRRLMERAGLNGERLGPQIVRHSASVQHMMHGGDLLSLKEELGHTTTRQTEKYGALAFPQVKQRHAEVNVLGNIFDPQEEEANLERAICYGCNQQIVVAWLDVKKTKCPACGQVGRWYTPDHRAEGE